MTKLENLKNDLKALKSVVVAFSGGVDSSFLLKVASEVLGENTLAITIKTPYMSGREIDEAKEFTKLYGIRHEIFEINTLKEIEHNPENRCYLCKKELFSRLIKSVHELGFLHTADGTNKDDLGEYRPGLKAARELGVVSPLINLTKNEIRDLSHKLNLPTFDKPSYACLLTRLPHGYKFSVSDLNLIEHIENLLIKNGYKNIRARFNGSIVRLQMSANDMAKFTADANFKAIVKEINTLGEFEISLDLKGLREEILR